MKETIKTSINFRANFSLRNITNKHEYHFMLQFNIDVHIGTRFSLEFQYILCYGSTAICTQIISLVVRISIHLMLRFNLPNGEYVPVLIDISIHLMLRFNAAGFRGDIDSVWFQYILCYGSTSRIFMPHSCAIYFNTSYVTVQRFKDVQPWNALLDFNTSYVTVQRTVTIKLEFIPEFQYILCYGSTFPINILHTIVLKFQYILCYGST